MPNARRLTVYLLVTLWLPALLHCRLEAAGMLFESECCGAAPRAALPAADHGCADDSCEVIEGEFTAPTSFTLKAPDAAAEADLISTALVAPGLASSAPTGAGGGAAYNAPPDLTRAWPLIVPGASCPRAP